MKPSTRRVLECANAADVSFLPLKQAIEAVVASGEQVTDEAAAMESAGHRPIMVPGNKDNIKVTREADLILATQILEAQRSETLV